MVVEEGGGFNQSGRESRLNKKQRRRQRIALRSLLSDGKMGCGKKDRSLALSLCLPLSVYLGLPRSSLGQQAVRRSHGTGTATLAHLGAAGTTRSRRGRV